MVNLVLYRKYRPRTFKEIVGQEHIVRTLSNAVSSGITSHAYLFSGPRGTGKTTIARLLAKSLNCQSLTSDSEPCNECSSCLEINKGKAIDLIEIDAASHRGIDDMRELRDGIKFAPSQSKFKVFILDESHQLSKDAANALLKTLEEPPAHAIFILATTDIHKMIPTIISRCQRFDFRKLKAPEIIERLENICQKEKVKIEKPALEIIALSSSGSMRDAESLLGQVLTFSGTIDEKKEIKAEDIKNILGIVDISLVSQLADFIFKKKAAEAIEFLNENLEKGLDPQEFAKALINYLRQALLLNLSPEIASPGILGLTKEQREKLKNLASNLKEEEIRDALKLFLEAENKIKYSPISQLPLELAIVEIAGGEMEHRTHNI